MNTRTVLFLVVILASTPLYPAAKTTTNENSSANTAASLTEAEKLPSEGKKKSRRKNAQKRREAQEERRAKAPKKRFDDGSRGSVHLTYQYMTFQELEIEKQKLIADKNYDSAIEYAKQQVAIATDAEAHLVSELLLEMSDLLYAKGDYDKAWRAYAQWAIQYPGANKKIASELQKIQPELQAEIVQALTILKGSGTLSELELINCTLTEHAAYRAVDAAYRCTEDHDRDQTQTIATIELADKFLQHKDRFRTHRATVELIRTACYEKVITSELNICSFYRQQGNHDAAKARLAMLEEEYSNKFPQTKKHVVAYRTQHYGETSDVPVEAPATLIATDTSKPSHAAHRF